MQVSGRTTRFDPSFFPCSIARMILAVLACQSPLIVLIWPMVTSIKRLVLGLRVWSLVLSGSCLFRSGIAITNLSDQGLLLQTFGFNRRLDVAVWLRYILRRQSAE